MQAKDETSEEDLNNAQLETVKWCQHHVKLEGPTQPQASDVQAPDADECEYVQLHYVHLYYR